MTHLNEKQHKLEGKIVSYYNGEKWLVRETCRTIKKAKELMEQIELWQKSK